MAAAAAAVPPESFQLDAKLFNQDLYAHIRSVWFAGLPAGAKKPNEAASKRWYGVNATAEERSAFDDLCRTHYTPALESIAPQHLALPPFHSYADDLLHAASLSAPFLRELHAANAHGPEHAALTLLSLTLLLDQMPRNIYRQPAGLRLVFTHYDRLAWTLVHAASSSLAPDPWRHAVFRGNPAYAAWLSLPLMHAEDLASQDACIAHLERLPREAREDGDWEIAEADGTRFGREHREVIERFGRFPHRNEGLGRQATGEEREWLKTGATFGVQQGQGAGEEEETKKEL